VFTVEDSLGAVEVVAFPEAYQRAAGLIETGTLVLVSGRVERDEETVRILAADIAPLDSVRERLAHEVAIRFRKPADRGTLETLGEIFARHRGDRRVSLEVETGNPPNRLRVKVDVSSRIRVRASAALVAEVEQVVGAGSVELR
jgi:DNA polymerase III subunit alpha